MTPAEIIQRGQEAQALLQNELLNFIWADVENAAWQNFKDTKALESEKREAIWAILQHSNVIKAKLNEMVMNWKVEQARIDTDIRKREFERAKEIEVERQTGMPFSQMNGDPNA